MTINIGKDCWDIIMNYKFQMEHSERVEAHKKKFNKCLNEMKDNQVDLLDMNAIKQLLKKRSKMARNDWFNARPIFLIFDKEQLIESCRTHFRVRNNPFVRMILNCRHHKIRIILLDEIIHERRIFPSIRQNVGYMDIDFRLTHSRRLTEWTKQQKRHPLVRVPRYSKN